MKKIAGGMMTLSLIMAAYGAGVAQSVSSSPSTTKSLSAGVTVPVTTREGRMASGTMRIERFEMRGSQIVAVGHMVDAAAASGARMSSPDAQGSGSGTASGSMASSTAAGSETATASGSTPSGSATMTTQDITNTYSTLANGAGMNSLTPSSTGYSTDPSSVDRPYVPDGSSRSSSASGTATPVMMSVPVEITSASCDALHLNLGPAEGSAAATSRPLAVTITSASVASMGGSNNLCQISSTVSSKGSTSTLVGHLNRLIGASPASTR